jgi:hypothetical protein
MKNYFTSERKNIVLIQSHRIKVERYNNPHRTKRRKTTQIGHILHKNTLKQQVIEKKWKGARRWRRWHKEPLDKRREAYATIGKRQHIILATEEAIDVSG